MSTEITDTTQEAVEAESVEEAVELAAPSLEVAERLFAEVDMDHAIGGLKMSKMGGSNPSTLFSLPEVEHFMRIGDYDEMISSQHATVGYVPLALLADWISQVVGDEDLAQAVRVEAEKAEFYAQGVPPIKSLIRARLAQGREVITSATEE